MARLIRETVAGELYEYYPLGKHVVRCPAVCRGRPTFKYTRIEITGTLERLAAGESVDDIVAGYRGRVSRDAILEAARLITAVSYEECPDGKGRAPDSSPRELLHH